MQFIYPKGYSDITYLLQYLINLEQALQTGNFKTCELQLPGFLSQPCLELLSLEIPDLEHTP